MLKNMVSGIANFFSLPDTTPDWDDLAEGSIEDIKDECIIMQNEIDAIKTYKLPRHD